MDENVVCSRDNSLVDRNDLTAYEKAMWHGAGRRYAGRPGI